MEYILPNAVQDPSIWEDSHVDVGHDNVMEMALTFVGEEKVGHPDFARVVECQILHPTYSKKEMRMFKRKCPLN